MPPADPPVTIAGVSIPARMAARLADRLVDSPALVLSALVWWELRTLTADLHALTAALSHLAATR